ncbi:MAG: penicillin-binding protein 2 [Actinomycetes bacterium]
MQDKSVIRLKIIRVIFLSLMITLVGRLFFLQISTGENFVKASQRNAFREIYTPPVRGLILDQVGRPVVSNKSTLVVSVNTRILENTEDKGASVITRLAQTLQISEIDIRDRLTPCGTKGAKRPPICWSGSLFQPIPIAKDVSRLVALEIMEQRTLFPGVSAELIAVRDIPRPFDVNMAHIIGYVGPVTDVEIEKQKQEGISADDIGLQNNDSIGRSGVERFYDSYLRGKPGVKVMAVDKAANIKGVVSETDPESGKYVVLNVDAKLQALVEEQLSAAIDRARSKNYVGESGAAVVVDVKNGNILAMATYPSYDPRIWLGGITNEQFELLSNPKNGIPLISRATQGLFAPASIYKVITTAAAAENGFDLNAIYQCPPQMEIGTRVFRNYESIGFGPITLQRAIEVSCDTVFYDIANTLWLRDGGLNPIDKPVDAVENMSFAFGLGSKTGIDLPEEVRGRVGGRIFKRNFWDKNHEVWCERAEKGYPEVEAVDPERAKMLQKFATENCTEGMRFRAGDAVNISIGQGDTVVTPLQMAMAYAAIANGGTVYEPRVVKAIMNADGSVAEKIEPKVKNKLPISNKTLKYIQKSLETTTISGTGAPPFVGFPLSRIPVATKTGTGEVLGKQSTSWFASYAPANNPQYAVVLMVAQGGTGSGTSAPSVRRIYEELFGIRGSTIDPATSILEGGAPTSKLPTIRTDGLPDYPEIDELLNPTSSPSPTPTSGTTR